MNRIAYAAVAIGLALLAPSARANQFGTLTVKGTPGVLYEFTSTIATKHNQTVPWPGPFIVVKGAAPGQPSTLVCNTSSGTTLPKDATSFTLSFGLQFAPGCTTYKLEFSSSDNNFVLKHTKQLAEAVRLQPIQLKAKSAGNYNVLLTLSTVYKGPKMPNPLPTFSLLERGPGIGTANGANQVTPGNVGSQLQLSFSLKPKSAGSMLIELRSPFEYLVIKNESCVYTNSEGKAVHLNTHGTF